MVGFYIIVENRKGIATKILDVFQEREVNLNSINFGLPWRDTKIGTASIIADFSYSSSSPEEVKVKISEIKGVIDVNIDEAKPPDFLTVNGSFPLTSQDAPVFVMNIRTFIDALSALSETLGGRADMVFYHLGHYLGRGHFERVLERFGDRYDPATLMEQGARMMQASGWARYVSCSCDKDGAGRIVLKDIFTGSLQELKAPKVACHFIRGYCCGFREALFNVKLECIETRCELNGDKNHEFVFSVIK